MKIQTVIAFVLSAISVSAQAGNWAVKNGWCQTLTDNGQALVMLKNNTIGIFGQLQGCPNGPQELMGSRISVNGNLVPTSQLCNQQTGFKAVEVEGGQAPAAARKAIASIAGQETSTLQVFGAQLTFTRGDMMTVCPKYVSGLAASAGSRAPEINKGSVMKAAKEAYTKEYDRDTAEAADFGSYKVEGNTVV
ncbi:hypothetical protein ACRZZB_005874, partial [Klebsiella oxytoca]